MYFLHTRTSFTKRYNGMEILGYDITKIGNYCDLLQIFMHAFQLVNRRCKLRVNCDKAEFDYLTSHTGYKNSAITGCLLYVPVTVICVPFCSHWPHSMRSSRARSMKRYGVRLSVRLSVFLSITTWAHSSKPAAADLLLWARRAGDNDRLLQQRRAAGECCQLT